MKKITGVCVLLAASCVCVAETQTPQETIERLKAENAALKAENARLKAKIAELEKKAEPKNAVKHYRHPAHVLKDVMAGVDVAGSTIDATVSDPKAVAGDHTNKGVSWTQVELSGRIGYGYHDRKRYQIVANAEHYQDERVEKRTGSAAWKTQRGQWIIRSATVDDDTLTVNMTRQHPLQRASPQKSHATSQASHK